MDRTERLLDLVALFLDAQQPVSWAQLKETFPEDYDQGTSEATERKFERDKAELLELGIPLVYVQGDEERRDGYVLSRDAYYLPEVDFSPEELAVLYAAGSAALASGVFPGQFDLANAMRKIGFLADSQVSKPRVRMELGTVGSQTRLATMLNELWEATAIRKCVRLTYISPRGAEATTRTVRPYGLALRRGVWALVAHCELRGDIRTFHLHRISELSVSNLKPRSPDFEVPASFRLEDYVANHAWQHRIHAPVDVTLELRGALAGMGERLFPGARATGNPGGVMVTASYVDGLLRAVLALAPDCRVNGPLEVVERFSAMVGKAVSRHTRREAA
ncbi:MAG: helix-turn-helix transcriptional regulator [Myxococcaceae bacterium]